MVEFKNYCAMITLKTKTVFPVRDERGKIKGNFIIYLKVDSLLFNEANVSVKGYYFTIENDVVIVLSPFDELLTWENIALAESNLEPIASMSLKTALTQRVHEFTMIQLMLESGENFETTPNDWELA